MSDLISRSAFLDDIEDQCKRLNKNNMNSYDTTMAIVEIIQRLILAQPTVEAKPVVHGKWKHLGGDEWYCSECCHVIYTEGSWEKPKMKFCEECGTDMRGGKNERNTD